MAAAGPDNALCPIGKEPIDPKVPTIKYAGLEIGFCCPGCDQEFLGWAESEKKAFVATVAAARLGPDNQICPVTRLKVDPAIETLEVDGLKIGFADAGARREFKLWDEEARGAFLARLKAGAEWGDPYMLPTCPVTGEAFDAEAERVIVYHEGRQVRLGSTDSIKVFEADPAKYLKAADEAIINDQIAHYPLKTCIVTGEDLGPGAVNFVYRNRLVRLCCEGCIEGFESNAPEMLVKLDEAVVDAQREAYPLATCVVVPADRLGEHKGAHEVVIGNRLVRLCCPGCEEALMTQPARYLRTLDDAWDKAAGGK